MRLTNFPVSPIGYIKFEDLANYWTNVFLFSSGSGGLEKLFGVENKQPYYSDLVRIFYANMFVNRENILTTVKGVLII